MKKLKIIKIILLFALVLNTIMAFGQKLPAIQKSSVWAPDKVKIDGAIAEWDNKFEASNHATDLLYTMANDDKNLYLVIQATDNDVINRIIGGGITLTIQQSKDAKNNVSVTYPVIERKNAIFINLRGKKGVIPDTSARAADSVMKRNNKNIEQKAKWILVKGVKDMDTLSVYNEYGIKACGRFDIKKAYNCELAIPLKYLSQNGDLTQFTYHLQVNGGNPPQMTLIPSPGTDPAVTQKFQESMDAFQSKLSAITDFWGEYTLAKK
ncbi:MAG TPA: hypothetical protein VL490_00980 [Mucilaginibacter sp.]|jgi:hypothetical protein|nr:hypothetical protein [Mucilaginibacter sp.]